MQAAEHVDDYLGMLNPAQRQAAEYGRVSNGGGFTAGPLLVIAGAGTGIFNMFYELSTPVDEETTKMYYIFFRNFMLEPENDAMHVERNLKNIFQDKANAETVMRDVRERGFHLQLPPVDTSGTGRLQ